MVLLLYKWSVIDEECDTAQMLTKEELAAEDVQAVQASTDEDQGTILLRLR